MMHFLRSFALPFVMVWLAFSPAQALLCSEAQNGHLVTVTTTNDEGDVIESDLISFARLQSKLIRLNNNAAQKKDKYAQPNSRPLDTWMKDGDTDGGYNQRLFETSNKRLQKLVGKDEIVLDLGGGQGRAMFELVMQTMARAFVINTQKFSAQPWIVMHRLSVFDRLTYIADYAENALRKFKNKAKLIVDMWGAFSYSPSKKEIIELTYEALVPGGEAHFFWASERYSLEVKTPTGAIPLSQWLVAKHPDIFSFRNSRLSGNSKNLVMEMRKPLGGPKSLNLNLRMQELHARILEDRGDTVRMFDIVFEETIP
jgi:hypothetical protein